MSSVLFLHRERTAMQRLSPASKFIQLVLERPSPAAGWIFLLWSYNFSTGLQRLRQAGALSVGARRAVSRPGALCVGARRSVSGPAGALSVGARRSLCRGPALFVSGPGALRRGLAVLSRRFLYRGPALGPALFVSGPRALCVAARRFVSGPGAPCVRARRSASRPGAVGGQPRGSVLLSQDCFCQVPAVCVSAPLSVAVSVVLPQDSIFQVPAVLSRPNNLCVGARRPLCRSPALCLSGPALFVPGPGALPGAPSLCRGPAVCVVAPRFCYRAPALSVRVCVEPGQPGLLLYRSSALFSSLCRARRSPAVSLCRDPALCVGVCVGARRSPVVSETGSLFL